MAAGAVLPFLEAGDRGRLAAVLFDPAQFQNGDSFSETGARDALARLLEVHRNVDAARFAEAAEEVLRVLQRTEWTLPEESDSLLQELSLPADLREMAQAEPDLYAALAEEDLLRIAEKHFGRALVWLFETAEDPPPLETKDSVLLLLLNSSDIGYLKMPGGPLTTEAAMAMSQGGDPAGLRLDRNPQLLAAKIGLLAAHIAPGIFTTAAYRRLLAIERNFVGDTRKTAQDALRILTRDNPRLILAEQRAHEEALQRNWEPTAGRGRAQRDLEAGREVEGILASAVAAAGQIRTDKNRSKKSCHGKALMSPFDLG